MDDKRLYQLLAAYAAQSTSPEEEQELFGLLDTVPAPELKAALRRLQDATGPDPALDPARWQPVLNRILTVARLLETEEGAGEERITRRLFPWTRVAAAAVITGVMVTGVWLWTRHRSATTIATRSVTTATKDIAPGGNRATLTLAGGATILLDSARNGLLVNQGNAAVTKNGGGQLAYSSTASGKTEVLYNTLTTPRGGIYQLVLPDRTKVWLNAASSITYPVAFGGERRVVKMTGEAYFEVAKDPARPFNVQIAPGAEVQVLGTSFNINAYTDESVMAATLLEGSIRFSSVTLKPGQQAQLSKSNDVKLFDPADIDRVMAWRNGQFLLKGTDMGALMRQIERWYDVDVQFDGSVPDKTFGGSISRNTNLSAVLEALKENGVDCRLEGKTITISK